MSPFFMKHGTSLCAIVITFVASGCAGLKPAGIRVTDESSIICVAPVAPFDPRTPKELLDEVNANLPFAVSPAHFMCKQKGQRLIAWIVVDTITKKDAVKRSLKSTPSLRCLQVERFAEEQKEFFGKHSGI